MKTKLLFTLLLSIGMFFELSAQCNAGYSSTAQTATGMRTQVGDTVNFFDSSSASGAYSSFWTFGDRTTGTQKNPYKVWTHPGWYTVCLTISDSNSTSCRDTYCDSIYVDSSSNSPACKADFYFSLNQSSRTVTITPNPTPRPSRAYTLDMYFTMGDNKFYNKSTTQSWSHTYSKDGSYTIKMVLTKKTSGVVDCQDSIYKSIRITNTNCKAAFSVIRDSLDSCSFYFRNASTGGTARGTRYVWDFGNGQRSTALNPSKVTYSTSGYYGVSLSISDSSNGCRDTYVDTIYAACSGNTRCSATISGQLFTGRTTASYARVFLIEKNRNILKAVQTTSIDSNGNYAFNKLCADTFYVKAALDSADPNYTDYLPTYYGDKLRWNAATTIIVTNSNQNNRDINMIKGSNPGGRGFIGGDVRKGANKRESEPLEDIQIVLLNGNGDAVANTYSDKEGNFSFDNLAFGDYELFAEVPGLAIQSAWISLTADNESVENVIVKVNSDGTITGLNQRDQLRNLVDVYPNPTSGLLKLDLPQNANLNQLNIYDLNGRLLMQFDEGLNQIQLNQLEPGMYLLELELELSDGSAHKTQMQILRN